MLYLSPAPAALVNRSRWGFMATPRSSVDPIEAGWRWGGDNGAFTGAFDEAVFFAWLERMQPFASSCLFIACPDVWGDAVETLRRFAVYASRIRALGFPVALVGQDGLQLDQVPWDQIDAFFIGGTDPWRASAGCKALAAEAHRRGLWVHVGRVNSELRIKHWLLEGVVDSVDGTSPACDPSTAARLFDRAMQQLPLFCVAGGA